MRRVLRALGLHIGSRVSVAATLYDLRRGSFDSARREIIRAWKADKRLARYDGEKK